MISANKKKKIYQKCVLKSYRDEACIVMGVKYDEIRQFSSSPKSTRVEI